MATCPRCWGHLCDGHTCHLNWRRLVGAVFAVACGAAAGAFAQVMIQPAALPVMGAVIGAILLFELPAIVHNFLDDHDWHLPAIRTFTRVRSRHDAGWRATHWREERTRLLERASKGSASSGHDR